MTTGNTAPTGEVGEIATRSVWNMAGYWNMPEATAKTIDKDGWLRTGDAGYIDEDGYVYIHDRVKDMIISGGENVYPAEVESAIYGHPDVADVAVIGVPDEKWGEAVKAMVVLQARQDRPIRKTSSPGRASASPRSRRPSLSTSSRPCRATPVARSCAANCASRSGKASSGE